MSDNRFALQHALSALDSVWAAIGDRLLAKGPLDKEYAQAVLEDVNVARERIKSDLASECHKSDSNELRAYAHQFRDWIADQIEDMEESYDRDGAPEQSAALHRAVEFIRASEANPPPKPDSVCERCDGTKLVTLHNYDGRGSDADDQPCPECTSEECCQCVSTNAGIDNTMCRLHADEPKS